METSACPLNLIMKAAEGQAGARSVQSSPSVHQVQATDGVAASNEKNLVWSRVPVIPGLGTYRQEDRGVQSQPRIHEKLTYKEKKKGTENGEATVSAVDLAVCWGLLSMITFVK